MPLFCYQAYTEFHVTSPLPPRLSNQRRATRLNDAMRRRRLLYDVALLLLCCRCYARYVFATLLLAPIHMPAILCWHAMRARIRQVRYIKDASASYAGVAV